MFKSHAWTFDLWIVLICFVIYLLGQVGSPVFQLAAMYAHIRNISTLCKNVVWLLWICRPRATQSSVCAARPPKSLQTLLSQNKKKHSVTTGRETGHVVSTTATHDYADL